MKKSKKKLEEKKEEKKEIRILKVIPLEKIRETKEKKQRWEEQKGGGKLILDNFESFISRDEVEKERGDFITPLIPDNQGVQTLEQDLALLPNSPSSEGEPIKYSPSSYIGKYGNMSYSNTNYEANNQYQSEMGQEARPLQPFSNELDGQRQFIPQNQELKSIQQGTRSQQDRIMDYTSMRQNQEEKKRKIVG